MNITAPKKKRTVDLFKVGSLYYSSISGFYLCIKDPSKIGSFLVELKTGSIIELPHEMFYDKWIDVTDIYYLEKVKDEA